MNLKKKKNLKSKILPINPNYPTDSYYKIGTVFPRKIIPKKYETPPKTAKALINYIMILTILIFQISNCGKPFVGWGEEGRKLGLPIALQAIQTPWLEEEEEGRPALARSSHWIQAPTQWRGVCVIPEKPYCPVRWYGRAVATNPC